MCQYSCDNGVVGEWHLVHLGSFATGGSGLIIAEASAVVPEGRISVGCPGLWNDEQVTAWRRVTDFVHSQGTHIGVQLAHAGRKGSTMRPWSDHLIASEAEGGWTTQAPSELAMDGYPVPHAVTSGEIDDLVASFASAATRALSAGFDVLEIHAAHGYLIHEFLSPLSNTRNDEYGGSIENRARFLLRIVDAVRAVAPTTPLFVRISATDYADGGWTQADSIQLCTWLKEHDVDLIDVSTGGNVAKVKIPTGPGYQVPYAAEIMATTGLPTATVGQITDAKQAESILRSNGAVAILAAREFLRNPHWAQHAAEELGDVIDWPEQYARARRVTNDQGFIGKLKPGNA
jgi:2,4-dienoyl-CoA reductase-like NADH-dependent reductase (Old Yellow Enzyme family)